MFVAPERGALQYPGCLDFIDLSACQTADVDFDRVRDAGFIAAAIKVTEGANGVDPVRLLLLEAAAKAGLFVVPYHFVRVGEDAAVQAKRFWELSGPIAYMPVFDLESAPANWTPVQIAEAGARLAKEIASYFGKYPIGYYGENFFLTRVAPAFVTRPDLFEVFSQISAWIAAYGSLTAPMVPAQGHRPRVPQGIKLVAHQYSGNCGYRVPGVKVDCDRNLFFGELEDFRALLGLPKAPPEEGGIVHPGLDFPPRDVDFE